MASLCSKDTSNKDKHASNQHISNTVNLQEDPSNIEVSPGMVSQECPPETESANKTPELSCTNGDKLFELKPFQIEEWSGDLKEEFGSRSWESRWMKYLNHNSRVFIQGKEFVNPHTLCLLCKTICTHPRLLSSLLGGKWDDLDCGAPRRKSHLVKLVTHHTTQMGRRALRRIVREMPLRKSHNAIHRTNNNDRGALPRQYDRETMRFYEAIEELIISAFDGCHMCTMILYDLLASDVHCELSFPPPSEPGPNVSGVSLIMGGYYTGSFFLHPHSNQNLQRSLDFTQSKVFESPMENTSQWPTSTSSEETFQLARSWLTECTSHHEGCNKLIDFHDFPTRLIHITGEDNQALKVRLRVANDLTSGTQYLTLSHVWGDIKNRFTLNTSNFEELVNEGICWQRLPKTFQDAILITYRLGFEYLWIDCLCIIQDSREDWNNEAPRMASIYGNSTCNIAALGKDSHAGCFRDRNPLSYGPCRIFSGEHGDIYFHTERRFNGDSIQRIKDAPLFRRAWIYQERILAPRNIYYGDSQIHWDCSQGSACEVAPIISTKEITTTLDFNIGTKNSISILRGCIDDLKENEVQAAWQDIIDAYFLLLLTEATDKFIALSAITNLFEKRFGLTYLHGLWKEHLPGALLWYIGSPLPKYSVTEVPSWSWAAVETNMKRSVIFFSSRSIDNRKTEMDAKVLGYYGVRNTKIGRDILGGLPRYSLTLQGWIKPVKYLMVRKYNIREPVTTRKRISRLADEPYDLISVKGKKKLYIDTIYLDSPISQIDPASCTPCDTDPDFYYLRDYTSKAPPEGYAHAKKQFRGAYLLLIRSGSVDDAEDGLVLEEYGTNPNHYIRVGYFHHRGYDVKGNGKGGYRSCFGPEESDTEERTIELF